MSYPLLMLWTLWNSWLEMCIIPQPSCFSHWERKLSQIIKRISNRGRTRRLIPYTGFDWPEPVIPHTCFLFVYWDRNTEKWIGFLCVASGISNTLYIAIPCFSFIYSIDNQIINCFLDNVQGLLHLASTSLFGFFSHPCPPAQFTPSTFCLLWVLLFVFTRSFPCLPPSPARVPHLTACITWYYSCLFTSSSLSLDQVPCKQEPLCSTLCSQCPEQGLTHNRWPMNICAVNYWLYHVWNTPCLSHHRASAEGTSSLNPCPFYLP